MMKGPYTFGEYIALRLLGIFGGLTFNQIMAKALTISQPELKQDLMSLSGKGEVDYKNNLWVKI